jgi:Polysaccharide lyase
LVGRDVWYRFSFLIPPGFPVVDNRLVIAQWKQYSVSGSPLFAERFRNGAHDLTIRLGDSAWGRRKSYSLPAIEFGRWNDMVYHIRFSRGDDGLVEVWMNGSRVVTYKGATAFKEGEESIYNKFGLYRDRWKDPMTIYFDNYTLADSFAAVDPARFDQRQPASR